MSEVSRSSRPVPQINDDNRQFWASCRAHAMALQRCPAGHFRYFPSVVCPYCGSLDFEWTPVSGDAVVYSFTIVHRPPTDAWDTPYVFALVELAEGPMLPTNIVGCDPGDVAIGMPVAVRYDDVSADLTIPVFGPTAETAG